jgi:hypothetical protein
MTAKEEVLGSIPDVGTVYFRTFLPLLHIDIFLQQPGIIKMPNYKLDLERYPQFLCENWIECK